MRLLRPITLALCWIACLAGTGWAAIALVFDVRHPGLGALLATAFALTIAIELIKTRASRWGFSTWIAGIAGVAIWWFNISPSNNQHWQPDVAKLPWLERSGDHVTLHNLRDCDYRSETNYKPRWKTETLNISQIRGVDLFLSSWGSPWIAHAIVSFQTADGKYLAMSIEGRKRVGQSYSALRGFFRQYNLIYVVAEERDVVRLRTNFRKDECVRLYHTKTNPRDAQRLFLAYLDWITEAAKMPEWYNALTSNCTSGIVSYLRRAKVGGLSRWDWRALLNGHGDEMLYDLGDLSSGGLSFAELRKQALINEAAQRADDAPDFSRRVRAGHPGFTKSGLPETWP